MVRTASSSVTVPAMQYVMPRLVTACVQSAGQATGVIDHVTAELSDQIVHTSALVRMEQSVIQSMAAASVLLAGTDTSVNLVCLSRCYPSSRSAFLQGDHCVVYEK